MRPGEGTAQEKRKAGQGIGKGKAFHKYGSDSS
jgi:hypothetical protein